MVASNAHAYFLAHMLSGSDVVTDGPEGERFKIDGDTCFLWIDLAPEAKFAHPTRYIFLSAQDVRVKEGHWWPVINDLPRFNGHRSAPSLCTPFDLANPTEADALQRAEVHIYPYVLSPRAKLTDGADGKPLPIKSNSLLIWLDLQPKYRFAHATRYVIVSANGVECVDGGWWPVLNERRILLGDPFRAAMPLPIILESSSK